MRLIKSEPYICFLTNITYEGLVPGKEMDGRRFSLIVRLDEDEDIIYLTLRDYYKLATTDYGFGYESEPPLHISELPEFVIHKSVLDGTCSGSVEAIIMDAIEKLLADISILKIVYRSGFVEFWLFVDARDFTAKFLLYREAFGEDLSEGFILSN